MSGSQAPVIQLPAPRQCRRIRCSKPFVPTRSTQLFCCKACKDTWKNEMRSAMQALDLLIELQRGCRLSKKRFAEELARCERTGATPPTRPRAGLYCEAIEIVRRFIADESAARDHGVEVRKYRRNL